MEQVRDHLQCNVFNLSLGVAQMRQGKTPTHDFTREFEQQARNVEMGAEASKVHLIAALNEDTLWMPTSPSRVGRRWRA